MTEDRVLTSFLKSQMEEGMSLARESDLLDLIPLDGPPPSHYIARFLCKGLVRSRGGSVRESSPFELGIRFPRDYLRRIDPFEVVTVLMPPDIWHPNIMGHFICLGHIRPGMPLVEVIYQCFEILTYHKWAPHDGLNPHACQWARNHQSRFPVDRRPLKKRAACLRAETERKEGAE